MSALAWVLLALAMATTAAVALALDAWLLRRREGELSLVETREVRMTCPISKQDVEVTFATSPAGERIEVTRCSAFVFPENVTCDRECLAQEAP